VSGYCPTMNDELRKSINTDIAPQYTMLQLQYILVYLCIVICIEICNSFCFEAYHTQTIGKIHSHNNNPSVPTSFVRHYQSNQVPRSAQYTTIQLWNTSPITTAGTDNDISNTQEGDEDVSTVLSDLHTATISAISNGLYIRSQSNPKMPLRYIDNGSMEEWEVTLTAGKIAQEAAEEYLQKHKLNPKESEDDEELLQVMAGRVVAVLVRLDELEDELLKRCINSNGISEEQCISLGIPIKELNAYQSSSDTKTAEIIDPICLFDTTIRDNRSKSLLAMFLHDIEGPGLRKNNVKIPCMDVDFLEEDVWDVLFGSDVDLEEVMESASDTTADTLQDDTLREDDDKHQTARPSLHPITIDAIEEAFRLRSQNSTTSPLRLINDSMEWFEVQYSVVKFADRFMEKYTKNKSTTSHDWTEEELQTIGGRIVGVLMRLEDLEWEWNHRVTTSSLVQDVESTVWKTTFGLHPDDIEQNCILTLDTALSEEEDFARVRAERMLGLFLLNVEGPFVEEPMPGGSYPDFIQDELQLKLMAPKPTKKE